MVASPGPGGHLGMLGQKRQLAVPAPEGSAQGLSGMPSALQTMPALPRDMATAEVALQTLPSPLLSTLSSRPL